MQIIAIISCRQVTLCIAKGKNIEVSYLFLICFAFHSATHSIVIITVAIRHDYYGVRDENGTSFSKITINLSPIKVVEFIPPYIVAGSLLKQGTIFGFVAPMLAIIIVSENPTIITCLFLTVLSLPLSFPSSLQINVVFLILGLNSLWKNKVKRAKRNMKGDDKNYQAAK